MGSPATTQHVSAILVRYHELALKGGNRASFERRLVENLRWALRDRPGIRIQRIRGRMILRGDDSAEALLPRLERVFGVSSLSPAHPCAPEAKAILETALLTTGQSLARFPEKHPVLFAVRVNRADKRFPISSSQFEAEIGAGILAQYPYLKVNLDSPTLPIEIDIREEGCWVFANRRPGPGGLPVGSSGRVLSLLSGGIDSPVSSWMAMKRGLRTDFVTFWSFPHVGPQAREKVIRQVENLTAWQPRSDLHIVPFGHYQEAVRDSAPEAWRTLLYRRGMVRIASILARRRGCRALLTGDSIGQVASQTVANLAVTEDAATLPLFRPLIGFDKQETIDLAHKIGTFETSLLPADDCCTLFEPEHPVIHGKIEEARAAESGFDFGQLVQDAVHQTEKLTFPEKE